MSENIASIEDFLFHGKAMLCSQDIQRFVSLIIPSTVVSDAMTSICT